MDRETGEPDDAKVSRPVRRGARRKGRKDLARSLPYMTLRTIMMRRRDDEITRTPQVEMPEVVQRALALLLSRGLVTTTRTRVARGSAPGKDHLWRRQVSNGGHPFGRIGSIRSRTAHGFVLRARMLGPALYDTYPSGARPKPGTTPGKDARVSFDFPILWAR